ncbi:Flagellar motor rotation protein MotB [hydrothermal vent metagenome]|uniref:Flagellar motor rotation protein MotB n=1 Tax=hydrothermal vent metagenome TaxID=652676 RepID=A0A3B0RKF5_9ZZZZ
MAQEIEEEEEGGGDEWMTTFADLMSLLLTFFILLLSFANMDVIKFRDAQGSLKDAFGVQFDDTIKGQQQTTAASIVDLLYKTKDSVINLELEARQSQGAVKSMIQARMQSNEDIYRKLQSIVRDQNLGDQVVVENTSRGVIITVNGQLFFHSGSAVLLEKSFPLLDSITKVVEEFPYKLTIEGHTDNTQIKTAKFPSNWELSAGRAISAVKYILSSGRIDPEKLGAGGYADTRPIAQNDTPEGRRINRRIEFVFFRDDMEIKEFTDFQQEEETGAGGPDMEGAAGETTEGTPAEGELTGAAGNAPPATGKAGEPSGEAITGAQPATGENRESKGLGETTPQPGAAAAKDDPAASAVPSTFKSVPVITEPSVTTPAEGAASKAASPEAKKGKARKKSILEPINILAPIGITPEAVEKPATQTQAPAPTKVKTRATAPTSTPTRRRAVKKKATPAKATPYVPGKFSAPTD